MTLSVRQLSRAAARDAWTALDAARPPRLAASWAWTETWLDHFGDTVEAELVAVEEPGRSAATPLAVALLTVGTERRRGVPVRHAHIGTAGEPQADTVYVERNALHAPPERRAEVARTLVAHLQDAGGWDELRLDGFVPDDAAALAAAPALGPAGIELDRKPSPWTDLAAIRDAGGDDVVAALRSGPRRRVRQTLRAFDGLELEWADDTTTAHAFLDELATLHQARWTAEGRPGAFSSARFTAFHHAAVARLGVAGDQPGAIVVRVRAAGNTTVGCLMAYVDGPDVLFYQSGLARFERSAQRAGHAAHALLMQECLQRGYGVYDFLPGEARYKDELATGEGELVWGTARARHLRARLLSGAAVARRRLSNLG